MLRLESHGEVLHIRAARGILGRPFFWGGAYLVDGLLVDCGPPVTAGELQRALAGRRVEALVVTHHHEDHFGGAARLHRERGLVPLVHAAGLDAVRRGFRVAPYRMLAWGSPRGVPAQVLGRELRTPSLRFEVHETPGHAPDHVCLYEPERQWLFTGDLFLAERLRYLREDEDLGRLIASLKRMAALPVARLFCAHRGLVADGAAALARKAARLEELAGRIAELLRVGLGEREIVRRTLGREGGMTWLSLGQFSARNFVRSVARAAREPDRPAPARSW